MRLLLVLKQKLEPVGIAPAEALALVVMLLGAAALTGVVWWGNRGTPVTGTTTDPAEEPFAIVSGSPGAEPGASGSTGDVRSTAAAGEVVVHVAGQVALPGLVRLAEGARVADAIQAAGGVTAQAQTEALNLARVVVDGEQIVVPRPGEEIVVGEQAVAPGDGLVHLNTATSAQLQELPGVGPVTADQIITHRDSIGGFLDVSQLLEVPGIGPGRFGTLEPLVAL